MLAARLHGPHDIRVEEVPVPSQGEVLVHVHATGICGSDLHTYLNGRIGDTQLEAPLILGHEFAGMRLDTGQRVAIDPAQPCHQCDLCQRGHPNLCRRMHFCGLFPDDGSLAEYICVPASTCFPIPDSMDFASAALLEPLGVALHATDLAKIQAGDRVAVLGAGPIGLLLLQTAKLAGAREVYAVDPHPWRLKLAAKFGSVVLPAEVDICFEAAWGAEAIEHAMEITRPGGRVVLVGIPSEDRCAFRHSLARRKGLTILFSRRMKHTYPRAIHLVESGQVDLLGLISHRFPLAQTATAFALNAAYQNNVVKIILEH